MAIEKILGIGQPEAVREFLSEALQSDYEVTWAATIAEGREAAKAQRFDLVIADADAPDFEGLSGPGQKAGPEWPTTIVIAGPAQREAAVKALNDVAFTYLLKPFSREELSAVIRRAAEHNQIFELCHRYGKQEENSLLGDSFVSGQLRSLLAKVAQTNIPVLVRGESGVGKELVARLIHRQGGRADGPFVKLECASIADESIESHLFGWSVWGPLAQGKRPQGVLELAAGGTLLIDEISLLPVPLQARLLKVLQEKKFQRTEGTRWMALDARIIATTTRELEKEVEKKAFNEQLFYALNVVPIWVPPLKERPQDIRALASTFANYFARKYGSPFEISREAIARFEHTDWTCNVRQLQIAIEQNVLGHSGFPAPTLVAHRGSEAPAANSHSSSGDIECLDELEKRHILTVLARCNGNRTLAAKRLGISIRTIRNKLKLYRTQQPNIELMPEAV
jgi:two-component system response regulator AtoC